MAPSRQSFSRLRILEISIILLSFLSCFYSQQIQTPLNNYEKCCPSPFKLTELDGKYYCAHRLLGEKIFNNHQFSKCDEYIESATNIPNNSCVDEIYEQNNSINIEPKIIFLSCKEDVDEDNIEKKIIKDFNSTKCCPFSKVYNFNKKSCQEGPDLHTFKLADSLFDKVKNQLSYNRIGFRIQNTVCNEDQELIEHEFDYSELIVNKQKQTLEVYIPGVQDAVNLRDKKKNFCFDKSGRYTKKYAIRYCADNSENSSTISLSISEEGSGNVETTVQSETDSTIYSEVETTTFLNLPIKPISQADGYEDEWSMYDNADCDNATGPCGLLPPIAFVRTVTQWDRIHGALLIVSCFFILFAILMYIFMKVLNNYYTKFLLCFTSNLLIGMLFYAIKDFGVLQDTAGCAIWGYFILFFMTSSYMWLACMSHHVWTSIGKCRENYPLDKVLEKRKTFVYNLLCAWGIPLIYVVIVLLIDNYAYNVQFPYLYSKICWFPQKVLPGIDYVISGKAEILYYTIPVTSALIMGILFVTLSAYRYFRVKIALCKPTVDPNHPSQTRFLVYQTELRFNIRLFMIMGIPWILLMLAEIFAYLMSKQSWTHYFHMVFYFINTLTGFMVFMLMLFYLTTFIDLKKVLENDSGVSDVIFAKAASLKNYIRKTFSMVEREYDTHPHPSPTSEYQRKPFSMVAKENNAIHDINSISDIYGGNGMKTFSNHDEESNVNPDVQTIPEGHTDSDVGTGPDLHSNPVLYSHPDECTDSDVYVVPEPEPKCDANVVPEENPNKNGHSYPQDDTYYNVDLDNQKEPDCNVNVNINRNAPFRYVSEIPNVEAKCNENEHRFTSV